MIYLSSKYNLQNQTLQGKSKHKLVYQSTNLDIKTTSLRHRESCTQAVAIHPHLDCRVASLLAMTGAQKKNEDEKIKPRADTPSERSEVGSCEHGFDLRRKFQYNLHAPNRVIFASIITLSFFLFPYLVYAGPQSTTYELKTYDFGGGGTAETDSTNYSIQGTAGSMDISKSDSTNYAVGAGLTFANQANVPAAPTFTNPATNYDRLKIIIDNGGNPSDAIFAIAISSDNFTTTYYVQDDNTISTTLGAEDWQTYANWGSGTGEFVRTLRPNTTYKVKVKAKNGKYTESAYSAESSATTSTPSLTFGVSANALSFNNLNSGNSYTDTSKSTTLTTSTNAYNGYIVYAHSTSPLTSGSDTIADYSAPNSAPTTWSGTGFGYTTDDIDLTGGTASRFSGSKFAGFTTATPGDPVADHTGPIENSAISSEQFVVTYRVTADASTKAGNYQNKIIYIVLPTY